MKYLIKTFSPKSIYNRFNRLHFKMTLLVWFCIPLLVLRCNGDDNVVNEDNKTATVEFVYLATTTINPTVQAQFPSCVAGVGQSHIHPSWFDFRRFKMTAEDSAEWRIIFMNVPVNQELRIRVSDPNVCKDNPTGASTNNVFANGVLLTRIVDTPGSGIEPGLAFRVREDGTVTP